MMRLPVHLASLVCLVIRCIIELAIFTGFFQGFCDRVLIIILRFFRGYSARPEIFLFISPIRAFVGHFLNHCIIFWLQNIPKAVDSDSLDFLVNVTSWIKHQILKRDRLNTLITLLWRLNWLILVANVSEVLTLRTNPIVSLKILLFLRFTFLKLQALPEWWCLFGGPRPRLLQRALRERNFVIERVR